MLHNFFVRNLQIFVQSWSVCYTTLEKLARYKHSSLLRNYVNYRQKSFIILGPDLSFQLEKWLYKVTRYLKGIKPKSCLGKVFSSKLGHIGTGHMAPSRVEI
jgi:hypothetical protein